MASGKTNQRPPVYGAGGLMPQPWVRRDAGSRTNTRLIRGPHISIPATVGLEVNPVTNTNKQFEYKWTHDWDTASQGQVVLPKGHMIAFDNDDLLNFADYDAAGQDKYVTGLSYLNLFKPVANRLAANRPGIAIRGYFELPVFASYADAATVAGHKWGAILAYDGELSPGDTMRICGSTTDGPEAPGWLTNANYNAGVPNAKLTPYDTGVIAQVLEFDSGPTFDGLLEWVQFDNPFEFEDNEAMWRNPDASKYAVKDPNSPTGFTFQNNPFDPRLQDPWFRDAAGIPNLSDGAGWETIMEQPVTPELPDATTGTLNATVSVYYWAFGGVGALLKADGTPWSDPDRNQLFTDEALTTPLNGATVNGGVVTVLSQTNDEAGTLTIDLTYATPGTGGPLTVFFKAKGQVAGVPAMIDVTRCIGLARFQLLVR